MWRLILLFPFSAMCADLGTIGFESNAIAQGAAGTVLSLSISNGKESSVIAQGNAFSNSVVVVAITIKEEASIIRQQLKLFNVLNIDKRESSVMGQGPAYLSDRRRAGIF